MREYMFFFFFRAFLQDFFIKIRRSYDYFLSPMVLQVYELYENFRVFYLKQCLVVKKKYKKCYKKWFV